MRSIPAKQFREQYLKPKKRNKYNNNITYTEDGKFDADFELERWEHLKLLERAGEIKDLKRQVKFKLKVKGLLVTIYIADFTYRIFKNGDWRFVVEDVKGKPTPEYILKKKLMAACHGINIYEHKKGGNWKEEYSKRRDAGFAREGDVT